MRERERACVRARGEDPVRDRELQLQSDGAIDGEIAIAPSIAIRRNRDRAVEITIALSIAIAPWSRSRIAIAPSRRDRDLGSRSQIAIVPWLVAFLELMIFFFMGCGLWLVACVFWFVFSFFFSKHQKIFSGKFFEMQPNTWKHFPFPEISISGKYVFSGKRFTATKHSVSFCNLAGAYLKAY